MHVNGINTNSALRIYSKPLTLAFAHFMYAAATCLKVSCDKLY